MRQKQKEQRVAVLIDVQNMYYSARHLYGAKVDFKEVLRVAVAGRKLVRSIAYVIKTEAGESEAFFDALSRLGMDVRAKDLQIFPGGLKKGDWDVGIAMDAVRLSSSLDTIVLVSGDGDFIPLVEYVRFAQPSGIEVVAFGRTTSNKLKEAVDDYFDLDQDLKRCLIKS